jgi:hypothetical protein
MDFTVLSCGDQSKWNYFLDKIPDEKKSPQFSPEYYQLFEERDEGKGICFIGAENSRVVLYPTLIRSVPELGFGLSGVYYDLQGAYGYNGPICNTGDAKFLHEFSKKLQHYFRTSKIIAEFIRFCPVIGNHLILDYIQPEHTLDNVMIDLAPGYDVVWKEDFDGGVRKAIRKAEGKNLKFEFYLGDQLGEEAIKRFHAIYIETMIRNKAEEYFLFPINFLKKLVSNLLHSVIVCFALYQDSTVSAELVLYNASHAYGFLGGTLLDSYAVSSNSFLRNELLKRLILMGVKKYSIGGGKSRNDSIYAYKKSFSRKLDSKFYIGKKIHDPSVYNELVAQWELKYPNKISCYNNHLLKYRY